MGVKRAEAVCFSMLRHADDVIEFMERAGSFETFANDKLYKKAIVMSLINIGELVKHLPDDFRAEHKEIPWKNIMGVRDVAAHHYDSLINEKLWETATVYVPPLAEFLRGVLDEYEKGGEL